MNVLHAKAEEMENAGCGGRGWAVKERAAVAEGECAFHERGVIFGTIILPHANCLIVVLRARQQTQGPACAPAGGPRRGTN